MQDTSSNRPVPVWLLGLTLLPLTATAQQTDEAAATLDTVTVTGQAATKTDTPFIETPQAVSLISREDIEEKGAQTVQRAANYTPGVFTNQIGASNRYDYLVLRGFADGSINNTFLDGLKLMGDSGSYSSMVIDPYFLESIEVVKGPASVLYGRASPGGLVAMQSKRPEFETGREIRLGVGTNDQRSAAFDLTGPLDDESRVAYRLIGLGQAADTQFGPVEEERYAIAPSLTWDISNDTSLTLQAYLQKDPEGGYHSGLPYEGTVESHNGIEIDNEFFEGEEDYEKFERTQRQFGYEFEHRFNDDLAFRQRARYLNSDVEMQQVYAYGWASDTELVRYYSGGNEDLQAWTLDNQLEARLATGAVEHTLLFGADYQQRDNDVTWDSGSADNLDVTNPQYGSDVLVTYTDVQTRELSQTGVYLQDQMTLDNWHLVLGLRNDWVDIENTNHTLGTRSEFDDTQVSGRAGLLYHFGNGVAPYLSYSTSFSPNATTDEDGDLLEPTKGKQIEAGLKYQPVGTQDRYSIALFHITQENVSTKDPNESYYSAVGEIESQGVELESHTQLTDNLSLQASYTYTDVTYAETEDDTEGNTANQVPRHQASAWVNYGFDRGSLAGLETALGVRHYADIWVDEANTEELPDYTLIDAMLGYDLSHVGLEGVSARVNVHNLLDKEYVASCYDINYCYVGEERNVMATVSYNF
ncbi:TonB-dependent siderophore receptor [Halomonas sp. McH1-25]|uniref:TonB-dependent siderophore receptor n=1 Tax=unclassified Halomonas TaxID=2609666 RepID=UPI001EF6577C|nr:MULTISPECIES: TonB-dependent siderophore receptor [unclassified Halomonas]MCG7600576.1 TonB-dependent siderophore receptor [Halomonas sp. McH1-25]MCP1342043.1 TonB-dependent siderophore receptor [Halomonas sp. FL8]MCP1359895.1 TonB-dependent siderophore receptor [Halomonas sp. BBD45]MCP1364682.1 TonB-dependent siderophore receptor [Halomonas sp. BBD48]